MAGEAGKPPPLSGVVVTPGFFQAQGVRMNVGRQREWKKRSQKWRAGVKGAASILGKDLAGAVDDLPAQIEILLPWTRFGRRGWKTV